MKKFFIVIIASLVALVSCEKEMLEPVNETDEGRAARSLTM